jgi:predicted nucleotidyltransferase
MDINGDKILAVIKQNEKYLNEKFGVLNIALFGSFARGEETENSDIDLLVEMDQPTFSKLAGLRVFLEQKIEREVNVVRKHSRLKPRFLKIIGRDIIYVT